MRLRSAGVALVAAIVTASVLAGPSLAPARAAPPAQFVLAGAGWGHGVGLSQYGARAQAAAGRSAAQILAHYYSGTAVSTVPDALDLHVQLLAASTTSATVTGGAARVRTGSTFERAVAPDSTVTFTQDRGLVVAGVGGTEIARAATVVLEWDGTRYLRPTGPASVVDVPLAGGRYRHGRILVSVVGGRLNVVNVLRLHQEYLYGVAEMPSSWPSAALEAQAVIARGYALANATGLKADCACHVYDEVRSQKFTGWSKEDERVGGTNYGTRWKAAVDRTSPTATSGQVVTYRGALATTYYFSSSGGRTQNSEQVWTATVPYLRSVPDPWSLDPANNPSFAAWTRTVSQAAMAAATGLPDVARLDLSARTVGGGVLQARATSTAGQVAAVSGETLRTRLGLPSTWLQRTGTRVAGADRWSTAVEVGKAVAPTSRTVVIVSGADEHLVDGLVAGPYAASLSAPLLLTGSTIPAALGAELTRRGADHAVVVGGPGAVPESVVASLRARGMSVNRVSGADRYATAAAVARLMGSPSGTAVIASGQSLPDALSASGHAAALHRPVLLVRRDSVPPATRDALVGLGVRATTCVGGAGVLSEAVRAALPSCFRAAGADRYATSVVVARVFAALLPPHAATVVGGRDASLVDALAAGTRELPVVLVPGASPAVAACEWVQRTPTVSRVDVVGGAGAVPDGAVTALRRC